MSEEIEITALGDWGDNTVVRLTERIYNVPVKRDGVVIGHADIDQDGMIHATIDSSLMSDEFRQSIVYGLADSISLKPNYTPAVAKNPEAYGPGLKKKGHW